MKFPSTEARLEAAERVVIAVRDVLIVDAYLSHESVMALLFDAIVTYDAAELS